jgi:hypothetical protein
MVKIPSLDDLKKAGTGLMDAAKNGTLVDTLKTHVENLGASLAKPEVTVADIQPAQVDDPVQVQIKAAFATVAEIAQKDPELAAKMQGHLTQLIKLLEASSGKKYDTN